MSFVRVGYEMKCYMNAPCSRSITKHRSPCTRPTGLTYYVHPHGFKKQKEERKKRYPKGGGGGGTSKAVIERIGDFVPDFDRLPGVATQLENSSKLADLHSGAAFFSMGAMGGNREK